MEKFVLLGKGINYSLSPKLHKIILDKIGVQGEYTLFNTDNYLSNNYSIEEEKELVKSVIDKVKNRELIGINVTQPYKELILSYLDVVDDVAGKIGAVNTVALKNGKITGYNTDYLGVIESIKKLKIEIKGKKVYILGTGGASKGVAFAVKYLEGAVVFVSREKSGMSTINYQQLEELKIDDELLINCTPANIPEKLMDKFKNIFNINYAGANALSNENLEEKNILDGLYMLVVQGIKAQELWQEKEIGNYNEIFEELQNIKA